MGKTTIITPSVAKRILELREQGNKQSVISAIVTEETGKKISQAVVSNFLVSMGMRTQKKRRRRKTKRARTTTPKTETKTKTPKEFGSDFVLPLDVMKAIVTNKNLTTKERADTLCLLIKGNLW